jgi:hypothetical protein
MRKAADKRLTTPALMAAIARPSLTLGGAIGHVSSVLGGSGLVRLRLTRPFLSVGQHRDRIAQLGLRQIPEHSVESEVKFVWCA